MVTDPEKADLFLISVDTHTCRSGEERVDGRLEAALRHIRKKYPYWDHSNGLDHLWVLSHPRGYATCPAVSWYPGTLWRPRGRPCSRGACLGLQH